MNHYPRLTGLLTDTDTINDILNQLADEGTVEPIDDPNNLTDFWDWADVVGIVDEFVPSDDPFWGMIN